jgi:hypothetical protein
MRGLFYGRFGEARKRAASDGSEARFADAVLKTVDRASTKNPGKISK